VSSEWERGEGRRETVEGRDEPDTGEGWGVGVLLEYLGGLLLEEYKL
jgi:hypothetical protein